MQILQFRIEFRCWHSQPGIEQTRKLLQILNKPNTPTIPVESLAAQSLRNWPGFESLAAPTILKEEETTFNKQRKAREKRASDKDAAQEELPEENPRRRPEQTWRRFRR